MDGRMTLTIDEIAKECLRAGELGLKRISKRTYFDDLMLRDRMKKAVAEAVGGFRADELFPAKEATIKIRVPKRYEIRSGGLGA
jgi:hypothetical protein